MAFAIYFFFMRRHSVGEDVFKELKFDSETVMFEWELMMGTVDSMDAFNGFFSIQLQKIHF